MGKEAASTGKNTLGLCLGASTVSLVHIRQNPSPSSRPQVVNVTLHPHEGDPKKTLISALNRLDLDTFDGIAATGRRFRHFVNLTSIPEPEAVETAYRYVKPPDISCPAVVSAGGETFMVYVLSPSGQISNVLTGNKCASGTGEFLLQQLRRMDVSLEEAAEWAATENPYHVSGRCSVFCKSDCTHATNKGVPRPKVTAGLCQMMANKILELLKKVDRRHVMITGGTTRNRMMIEYLRNEIEDLIVPDEASYFEALGAALWAMDNDTDALPDITGLFHSEITSFDVLEPLKQFTDQVEFKSIEMGTPRSGDTCILGLDVGSTTTKAVLMRMSDQALLASIYLRTSGDPVGASRKCYRAILDQIERRVDPESLRIEGLGVCGSGRQIAGLHALTEGIINEIIAHAAAAVYFDAEVDTIFEIGGQDAKYTYITNGVPSDYAMNEACSAGTGSFLEESALETLGVEMEAIADIALKGTVPPNFNDQCAAFIASDIKNAIHEGVRHEDIVAGLVYSICMNYANRVKGNRPVGEKVFMQGGVCYNRAVPLAMAALVGKPIIVPPEPGLMGAFGVALAVQERIRRGLMDPQVFELKELADREVVYGKSFVCRGGKEKCDRRCDISMIHVKGRKYPFGGACNRYYNLRHNLSYDVENLDLVRLRQHLIFEKYAAKGPSPDAGKAIKRVGINRSFQVNSYYPLYSHFFTQLGFEPVLPSESSQKGIDQRNAAYCYPAELAHGFFYSLLDMAEPPEVIFLPHFRSVPVDNPISNTLICPLAQGEPFYLKATYREQLRALEAKGVRVVTPLIDLREGLKAARAPMINMAKELGVSRKAAVAAFEKALVQQKRCMNEMREIGREALDALASDPDRTGVVIFGRPYNAFVEEAHMGIPHKLASRGVTVFPLDFLPVEGERAKRHMFWGMGQQIMRAARLVRRHPQLFGTFITNFSCGPDSFVVGYFRDIMGRKPSLTLELDSHTADAGLETRIEAFLDIVAAYRNLGMDRPPQIDQSVFLPASMYMDNGRPQVVTSSGETLALTDPRVTVLFPSMGRIGTELVTETFHAKGINAYPHPPADEAILKLGRANTSCKECLPLILTTGTLLNYIHNIKRPDEVLVYFMATGSGPCRFGQYKIFMEDLIRKRQLPNVTLLSLSADNSYAGMGTDFKLHGFWAIVIADVMEDIRSMLLVAAEDPDDAMAEFEDALLKIRKSLLTGRFELIEKQLRKTATRLRQIRLTRPTEAVPVINLTGEIFVRRDGLSRQCLTERLAEKGFATSCTPIHEWLRYSDYLLEHNLADERLSKKEWLGFQLKKQYMTRYERRIKTTLAESNLVRPEMIKVSRIVKQAAPYISRELTGEAVLTVGGALDEVAKHACGIIAIGPFGCMPNRLSEAILNEVMNREDKLATDPGNTHLRAVLAEVDDLPFLAIESDGSPFPQVITAKLEAFCLRAERLHHRMMRHGGNTGRHGDRVAGR